MQLRLAQAGETVILVNERDRKQYIRVLEPGDKLDTHRGVLAYDDLIGQPVGSSIKTHMGYPFFLLLPTTDELVRDVQRESQIIFPKDAGYIIMKLGIKPGSRVLEVGTGSGGLCLALATIVGEEGHIYSYDYREKMQNIARKNLRRAGLTHRVSFQVRDALEGFDETDVDALMLDLLTPWNMLSQAHAALRGGGMLGCLVPTVNQMIRVIASLEAHSGFAFIEAEELILRPYKVIPDRVRPDERMIGHTGFLIFARSVVINDDPEREKDLS